MDAKQFVNEHPVDEIKDVYLHALYRALFDPRVIKQLSTKGGNPQLAKHDGRDRNGTYYIWEEV
jgi:hypothetical protein